MVHRNPLKKDLTVIPDIRCPWKLPYTGDIIGHCEKKVPVTMSLILNG